MFKTRLISGIVLVIIAVAVLYIGGPVTGLAMMALSIVGVFELCRVYKIEKTHLLFWPIYGPDFIMRRLC